MTAYDSMNHCVWFLTPNKRIYNIITNNLESFDNAYVSLLGNSTNNIVGFFNRTFTIEGMSLFVNFTTDMSVFYANAYYAVEPILAEVVATSSIYHGKVLMDRDLKCVCSNQRYHYVDEPSWQTLAHGTSSYAIRKQTSYDFAFHGKSLVFIHNPESFGISYDNSVFNTNEYGFCSYQTFNVQHFYVSSNQNAILYISVYDLIYFYDFGVSNLLIFSGNGNYVLDPNTGSSLRYIWNVNPFLSHIQSNYDILSQKELYYTSKKGNYDYSSNVIYYASYSQKSYIFIYEEFSSKYLKPQSKIYRVEGKKIIASLIEDDGSNGDSGSTGSVVVIVIASIIAVALLTYLIKCYCCSGKSCSELCSDCIYITFCCCFCDSNNTCFWSCNLHCCSCSYGDDDDDDAARRIARLEVANGNDNHEHTVEGDHIVWDEKRYNPNDPVSLDSTYFFNKSAGDIPFLGKNDQSNQIKTLINLIAKRIENEQQNRDNNPQPQPSQP
jgi:hypothetical protein